MSAGFDTGEIASGDNSISATWMGRLVIFGGTFLTYHPFYNPIMFIPGFFLHSES
ncbi:hypothetical protein [Tolypothrix sp. VBCCA 56010]|uniref:hypothetical protein n=1 Tax=Tolypothrix sp. VBCCA 56010 TaxID=3137731 RepID=UPI003D7D7AB0